MEFKLIEYPEREAKEIVEIMGVMPESARPGIEFFYNGKKYKILAVNFFARKVTYDDSGKRTYEKIGENINPLKDTGFPTIIVTEVSTI